MIQNLDTLLAIRHQEEHYAKHDFFEKQQQNRCCDIDIECRNKISEWLYQTIDFCQFNRETVEIAMSYLDRFLLTPAGAACMQDRTVYQLASMTALYTAIKIHERELLNPKIISELSRGAYTCPQIEKMEATILSGLDWRVNPPTALSFVREFLALLFPGGSSTLTQLMQGTILTLASAQIDRAVSYYPFLTIAPSMIAYCAFINALEATGAVQKESMAFIERILAYVLDMDTATAQVKSVHDYLYPICLTAAACTQPSPQPETVAETSSSASTEVKIRVHMHASPRAVTNTTC